MAITADQTSTKGRVSNSPNPTVSSTFSTRPTVGSVVVIWAWSWSSPVATHGTATDNQGNTYTKLVEVNAASQIRLTIYAGTASTSSGTFTVSVPITSSSTSAVVVAESFLNCSLTQDITAITNSGTSSTASTGTSATTTQADCVALAGCNINGNGAITEGVGYTLVGEEEDGNTYQVGSAVYKILSATGTQSTSWTFTGGSNPWATSLAVLRGSGGGGTTFPQSVSGSLSFAGGLSKQTSKSLAGSLSFVGTLKKQITKTFAGAVSFAGSLAATKVILQVVGGALSFAGSLTKQAQKSFTGSFTASGTLTKTTSKSLSGSVTPTGTLLEQFVVLRAVSGALSFLGGLVPQFIAGTGGTLRRFYHAVYSHAVKQRTP